MRENDSARLCILIRVAPNGTRNKTEIPPSSVNANASSRCSSRNIQRNGGIYVGGHLAMSLAVCGRDSHFDRAVVFWNRRSGRS
jgi:hypothetical protein